MSSGPTATNHSDLGARAAALSPAKRALLERRLKERAEAPLDKPILRRRQEVSPLSFTQELLWLVDQLAPGNVNYNVPRMMRLRGHLNVEALERALTTIVERHEVLRTSILVVDGEPVQKVRPPQLIAVTCVDVQDGAEDSRLARALAVVKRLMHRSFDLSQDQLLRPTVIRFAPDDQIVLLESHHIASDGWSRTVLFKELEALYEGNCLGAPVQLPELPIQYSDYAVWQRETLPEVLKQDLDYWRQQLAGAPPLLEFPTAKTRPPAQSFEGAAELFWISKETLDSAQQFSAREAATLFMTLLAAFDAFLARYTGQTDLVVGTPMAGRNRPEQEQLIGYFTNTLALRTDLSGDPTFREIVRRVRQTALSAYEHQDLPFEILVKELRPERTLRHSPVFQVMFAVGQGEDVVPRLHALEASSVFVERDTSRFDLVLGATVLPDGLGLGCEYNTDIFDADVIGQITRGFRTLLTAALANPDHRLSQLPLLTDDEARQQIVRWNSTAAPYPQECIHTLFECQAKSTPHAVAVEDHAAILTYQELDARANQLAHWLITQGVVLESPIGVCLQRSVQLAVALLAVQKAGAACVLLDPSLPAGRLQQVADDAHLLMLLTENGPLEKYPASSRFVVLERVAGEVAEQPTAPPAVAVAPDNLAYIIYTSGSTGVPKGVLLTHRGMVNHHTAVRKIFGLTAADRMLQFSLLGFDICLEEMFPTWLSGGAVVFRSETISGREFLTWLERHRITVMDVPTAFWHEWVRDLTSLNLQPPDSLRLLIVGGERASRAALSGWQRIVGSRVRWLNTYGPTEASIIATAYEPPQADPGDAALENIPIGRPIANVRVYLLDASLCPVPVGAPGEMYIGGAGVARGYLYRPELTAEKFVASPFVDGDRLYRTGDLARYRPDGDIEFIGRTDDQVKVRGFRVEPSEIESVLRQCAAVSDVAVLAIGADTGKRLVAFVVSTAGMMPTAADLRAFLEPSLPDYMIPSSFAILPVMPLTPHGKVDRAALATLANQVEVSAEPVTEPVAPRDARESTIAAIFCDVLHLNHVGIRDDFFALGGHSLLAIRIVSRIREAFGVDLSMGTVFASPTVERLAREVASVGKVVMAKTAPITRVARDGYRLGQRPGAGAQNVRR